MKVQSWYDVECSICGRHLCDYNSGMQRTKALAISHAKTIGWKFINKENVCPKCQNMEDLELEYEQDCTNMALFYSRQGNKYE